MLQVLLEPCLVDRNCKTTGHKFNGCRAGIQHQCMRSLAQHGPAQAPHSRISTAGANKDEDQGKFGMGALYTSADPALEDAGPRVPS